MAIGAKEKAALEKMWKGREAAGGDVPEGRYRFRIKGAKYSEDQGKPKVVCTLVVVDGDHAKTELPWRHNLESAQNMGWFERTLARLGIAPPKEFSDIRGGRGTGGETVKEMAGREFEGQVKVKNDFVNIYVNRLVGDSGGDEEDADEIEVGSRVAFDHRKEEVEGEVLSVDEDAGKAKIQIDDGPRVTKPIESLALLDDEEEDEEDYDDEEEDEEESEDDSEDEDDDDEEDEEEDDEEEDEDEEDEEDEEDDSDDEDEEDEEDDEEESDDEEEDDLEWPETTAEAKKMKVADCKDLLDALEIEHSASVKPKDIVVHLTAALNGDPVPKLWLSKLGAAMGVAIKKPVDQKRAGATLKRHLTKLLG